MAPFPDDADEADAPDDDDEDEDADDVDEPDDVDPLVDTDPGPDELVDPAAPSTPVPGGGPSTTTATAADVAVRPAVSVICAVYIWVPAATAGSVVCHGADVTSPSSVAPS